MKRKYHFIIGEYACRKYRDGLFSVTEVEILVNPCIKDIQIEISS